MEESADLGPGAEKGINQIQFYPGTGIVVWNRKIWRLASFMTFGSASLFFEWF
jgi:hypothetical protein